MIKYLTSEVITYQFVWIAVGIIFLMLIGRCVYLRFKLNTFLDEEFDDIRVSALKDCGLNFHEANSKDYMKNEINNVIAKLGEQYIDENGNVSDENVELFYFDYFIETQKLFGMNNYNESDIIKAKEEIHNRYNLLNEYKFLNKLK